jgi:hypothetical protein
VTEERILYYAITGGGKSIDDPHGIVRRRTSPEIGILDEALHRDLKWHRTGIIAACELEEVSTEKALQIINDICAGGPYG